MSGPIKMYRLKPVIIHDFAVELPKCMYRMRNIHWQRNIDDCTDHVSSQGEKLDIFYQNSQEIPGMAKLVARQNDILDQLAQLKKQIYSLKCDLNLKSSPTSEKVAVSERCSRPLEIGVLPESIVVNAKPTNPPYSLEILQRLLQNQVGLAVTSYLHSSIASLPEPANQLKESLTNFKPKSGVPVINIRLIWKNINSDTEFLLSHTPLTGEVNLLRYLSRLKNSTLNYDSDATSTEIDSILDQSFLLVRAKTKTERTSILQTFNKSLGKSQWLAGRDQSGIADVAAFSAIRQCLTPNELSANLGKWYERCLTLAAA